MLFPDEGDGGTPAPTTTAEAGAAALARIQAANEAGAVEGAEPEGRPRAGERRRAAAEPPTPQPEPEPPAQTPAEGGDPFDDESVQTFDRAYVEKLRREAAQNRTRAKSAERFEAAFEGYSDEEVGVLLDLTAGLANPDRRVEAATQLQRIGQAVLAEGGTRQDAEEAMQAAAAGQPEEQVLTVAEYERLRAEEARDREAAIAVEKIESEALELGYAPENPDTPLFWHFAVSSKDHPGDLQEAHKAVQAYRQAIIDGYIAEARSKNSRFPALATTGATPASGESAEAPKDFKSAREAVEARVRAAR